MGIQVKPKPRNAESTTATSTPVRRTEKEKLKARMAAFSPTDNARVAQLQTRSQNGFKGERLNDHGLPLGDNLGKETPIIQAGSMDTDNPDSSGKFRKQKYAQGTKGIKTKSGMNNFISNKGAKNPTQVNEMKRRQSDYGGYSSTQSLDGEAASFAISSMGVSEPLRTSLGARSDSLAAESARRKKASGKYADGSKGIKVKSKGGMSNFINGESDKVKTMSDEDLKSATMRNMNFQTTKQNDVEKNLLDETVNRKYKKQGGYAEGVSAIETKKTKVKLADAQSIPATLPTPKTPSSNPFTNKSFVGPPTETQSKSNKEDNDLDVAAKEERKIPQINAPSGTKSIAQAQDMEKVKQHQEKLNKYGANLKVDGMWGEKTAAASRDLYSQYKEKPAVSKSTKAPVSDDRMQGLFGSSGKDPIQAKSTGIKTASKATTPITTSKVPSQSQNTPSTNSMANFVSTKGVKSDRKTFDKKFERADNQEVKSIDKELGKSKEDPGVAEMAAGNPVPDMGTYASAMSNKVNNTSTISEGYRDQLEGRRRQLRPQEYAKFKDEVTERPVRKTTTSGKSLDGTDAAIYGAEAAGPAIANSIKGGGKYASIAKAALRFGPGIVDFAKTAYDDKDSTATQYLGSAAKAATRAGILGTAGSVAAGASRRVAGNIVKAGEEAGKHATALNKVKSAISASENAATGALNKKSYDAAIAAGKAAEGKLAGLSAKPKTSLGVGTAINDAFNSTGAGKAVTAVTQNKLVSTVKGFRNLNSAKKGITTSSNAATSTANNATGAAPKATTYLEKVAEREAKAAAKATADAEAAVLRKETNAARAAKAKTTQVKNASYDDAVKENKTYNKVQKGIKTKKVQEFRAKADEQLQKAEATRQAAKDAAKQAELDKVNAEKFGYKGRTGAYEPAPASEDTRRHEEMVDGAMKKFNKWKEDKEVGARVAGYKAKADVTRVKNKAYSEAQGAKQAMDMKERRGIKTVSERMKSQIKNKKIKKQVEKIEIDGMRSRG